MNLLFKPSPQNSGRAPDVLIGNTEGIRSVVTVLDLLYELSAIRSGDKLFSVTRSSLEAVCTLKKFLGADDCTCLKLKN